MKTLDEVINKLKCYPVSPSTLPCSVSIVTVEDLNDALHYLKEYQTILPLVPSLINTAIEVQKKGKTIG